MKNIYQKNSMLKSGSFSITKKSTIVEEFLSKALFCVVMAILLLITSYWKEETNQESLKLESYKLISLNS